MYIKVKVTPNAKKESFVRENESHFTVSVREEAKQNLANTRVRELVAAHFGASVSAVRIISGHHSPGKLLRVDVA